MASSAIHWAIRAGRLAALLLTLLGQVVTAAGLPLPVPRAAVRKDPSVPFPCQDRPCGCASARDCWENCCCFSREYRRDWAKSHGVDPAVFGQLPGCTGEPDCPHCRAEERPEEAAGCCAPSPKPVAPVPEPVLRWVVGVFAQKCQGQAVTGAAQLPPGLPPPLPAPAFRPAACRLSLPAVLAPADAHSPPLEPPPRCGA